MNFIQNIENDIILYLYNFMSNSPILKEFFSIITHLGNGGFIWIIIGLIFLIKKSTRKFGLIMLVSLLIGDIIGNLFLKNLIARNRPFIQLNLVPLINPPFGYSFPSGHSLTSFAGATVVFNWNKKIGIFAYILALLIAISRPLLSVHYISDIFSGAILGILISYVSCKFLKKQT
ncbi:MAG: phosphatase PAP2 family protein [Eubacteriales bacterium]|nr:phosphatase PAP2 family protein [Eubacteriales bacterium]